MYDKLEVETKIKYFNIENLLLEFLEKKDLCNFVVKNNLFWKNIKINSDFSNDNEDIILKIIEVLYLNTKSLELFNDEMIQLLNLDFDRDFYDRLLEFFKSKNISTALSNIIEEIIKTKEDIVLNADFIICLSNTKEFEHIINNNLYCILNKSEEVLYIKYNLKDKKSLEEKLNHYINNNPSKIVREIIRNGFRIDENELDQQHIFTTIDIIIKEILENENKTYSDIEFIGKGVNNKAYLIGDKVLKLSQERESFNIPNNKRFLQPLLRTPITKYNSNETLGYIEITEKVDTKNIGLKEVYEVYASLRDDGLVWEDLSPSNIGRLLKDNKIYFQNLNPTKEAINYTTEIYDILPKGEVVLLDNEFIYKENEFHFDERFKDQGLESLDVNAFEAKYQEEKKQKNY